MTPFRCNVTNVKSTVPIATAKLPRRCGADPANKKLVASPSNCTYGAKQPFYWFQAERNNVSVKSLLPFIMSKSDFCFHRCLKAPSRRHSTRTFITSVTVPRTIYSRTLSFRNSRMPRSRITKAIRTLLRLLFSQISLP